MGPVASCSCVTRAPTAGSTPATAVGALVAHEQDPAVVVVPNSYACPADDAERLEGLDDGVVLVGRTVDPAADEVDLAVLGSEVGDQGVDVPEQLRGHTFGPGASRLGVTDSGSSNTLFIGRPEDGV